MAAENNDQRHSSTADPSTPAAGQVVDLMAALEESVKEARNAAQRDREARRVARPAPRIFAVWPAEGAWERSMYDLFRQFPRVQMDMTDDEWAAFSSSLERQGITLREVEHGNE